MRKTTATMAVAALLAGLLTGCDVGGDRPEHEQAFLDAVHKTDRATIALGAARLLEVGYAVCDDLAGGLSVAEVVGQLSDLDGPIGQVGAQVVSNAETYLCDQ